MREAADSFRQLGTAEMRLWPFSHYLSTFFRSPHCLRTDSARKPLIPELVSVSLWGAMILHSKGFGRLVGGDRHCGKEPPPPGYGSLAGKSAQRAAGGIYSDMRWASSPVLQSLQGQHGCFKSLLHPATWAKNTRSFCGRFTCPSPASLCKHRL